MTDTAHNRPSDHTPISRLLADQSRTRLNLTTWQEEAIAAYGRAQRGCCTRLPEELHQCERCGWLTHAGQLVDHSECPECRRRRDTGWLRPGTHVHVDAGGYIRPDPVDVTTMGDAYRQTLMPDGTIRIGPAMNYGNMQCVTCHKSRATGGRYLCDNCTRVMGDQLTAIYRNYNVLSAEAYNRHHVRLKGLAHDISDGLNPHPTNLAHIFGPGFNDTLPGTARWLYDRCETIRYVRDGDRPLAIRARHLIAAAANDIHLAQAAAEMAATGTSREELRRQSPLAEPGTACPACGHPFASHAYTNRRGSILGCPSAPTVDRD